VAARLIGLVGHRSSGRGDRPYTPGPDLAAATDPALICAPRPRAAVERQFEIIGEAFAGLRRVDPALAAAIPDLPRIVAFRNVLIHGYATVDDRLVWGVVERDLPGLLATLARLLAEAER
jgi:uncharacterized protein with HEPN domain